MDCRERILSNDYYDLITDFPLTKAKNWNYDLCYVDVDEDYHVMYISKVGIPDVFENLYDYQNIPKLYGLMQSADAAPGFHPNNLIASGITRVQREPLSLVGKGVVLCFIDTGVDYTNAVFRDANGGSRILAIWDQSIQDGTPPEGFLYGSEYTREDINRALGAENPYAIVPSQDENGHGTSIAGVAAGSTLDGGYVYQGAAPEADLVIVKLKECKPYLRDFYLVPEGVPAYQENDIMLAVKYADSFARVFERPVVICLGLGTNMGDHKGNSYLSRYFNAVAVKRSRGVVVCGGNEGNAAHHYQGMLPQRADSAENVDDVEIRVDAQARGFYMELWGNAPDVFHVSIRTPGGETVAPVRLGIRQSLTYDFVYEKSRITIDGALAEPVSGEQLVRFRVQDPTPGIWTFRVSAVGAVHNGEFHLWLPITDFMNAKIYFLRPNPYTTLTEPAMADDVISVSAYNAENNSFYAESGRGFARQGISCPDFAAPGVNVSTVFGMSTGSSLAAAIAAGAVAQFMQWAVVELHDGNAQSREIKNHFIRGASRDAALTYPNREFGYGRLNIAGVFDAMIGV